MRHVDGAAMDYFLIELVETIRLSSVVATARQKKIEQEMIQAGFVPPSAAQMQAKKDALGLSGESPAGRGSNGKSKESEEDESVRVRLEAIGVHVGANFTERCVCCLHGSSDLFVDPACQGYVVTDHLSQIPLTPSSSFARICGRHFGTSKSTTCAPIIV
jgi:ribosomal protein L12E/L44/L45/RPP1/RPP2